MLLPPRFIEISDYAMMSDDIHIFSSALVGTPAEGAVLTCKTFVNEIHLIPTLRDYTCSFFYISHV